MILLTALIGYLLGILSAYLYYNHRCVRIEAMNQELQAIYDEIRKHKE